MKSQKRKLSFLPRSKKGKGNFSFAPSVLWSPSFRDATPPPSIYRTRTHEIYRTNERDDLGPNEKARTIQFSRGLFCRAVFPLFATTKRHLDRMSSARHHAKRRYDFVTPFIDVEDKEASADAVASENNVTNVVISLSFDSARTN